MKSIPTLERNSKCQANALHADIAVLKFVFVIDNAYILVDLEEIGKGIEKRDIYILLFLIDVRSPSSTYIALKNEIKSVLLISQNKTVGSYKRMRFSISSVVVPIRQCHSIFGKNAYSSP